MPQASFAQIPFELIRYVRSCKLSRTQYDLWLYIYEIDPFGDRWYEMPSPGAIAEELGVNERTIERAAQRLRDLHLIDFEVKTWRWRNSSKNFPEESFPQATKRSKLRQKDPNVENGTKRSNFGQKDPKNGQKDPNREPEPLHSNGSKTPHTIQTYSDFKDSLSQEERESFLEFGLKKASQLPRPPELPLKWVEKNWEDLRNQWEKSQGRVSSSKASKWENHPQREEWLEKIRHLGPVGFQAEDMPNQKMRREFYMWADENNLIWGEMES